MLFEKTQGLAGDQAGGVVLQRQVGGGVAEARALGGGLPHPLVQFLRRLLLEDVEVAVAAHLEHLGADLHAAARRSAHVEIDLDLHDVPLSLVMIVMVMIGDDR